MIRKGDLPWWMITLLLGFIGGVVGLAYPRLDNTGVFARWQRLGTSPEKPAKFYKFIPYSRLGYIFDIVIELYSGRMYQFNSEESSWVELISYVPDENAMDMDDCYFLGISYREAFSRLPGKISICGRIVWGLESSRDISYYVVLENNSVWTWNAKTSISEYGSYWGWDEITAIGIGWLAILFYRLKPVATIKIVKIGYLLVSIWLLTVAFFLIRMATVPVSYFVELFYYRLFIEHPQWCCPSAVFLPSLVW